jgi:hypothetical protein
VISDELAGIGIGYAGLICRHIFSEGLEVNDIAAVMIGMPVDAADIEAGRADHPGVVLD